jgi:arylsulfatase A-like enzyme
VKLSGPALESQERVLANLLPNETWTSPSTRSYIGPVDVYGPGTFMRLYDEEDPVVRIPVPPDHARFNRIDVELMTRTRRAAIELRGLAGEATPFKVIRPVRGQRFFQTISIPVPYWAGSQAAPEFIELEVQRAPRVLIASVRLVEEDWTRRLPSPEAGLVPIAGQTRLATGISTAAPLEGQVHVPPDGLLHVAASIPLDLRWPGRVNELIVRLGQGPDAIEERLALVNNGRGTWAEHRFELGHAAGRVLPLRFELVAQGDRESFAVVAAPLVTGRQEDPPTIVLITSDTHRSDYIGAAGEEDGIETPTLDALAAEGVLYESCFATTNVTIPSHAALLTGVHVRDTRIITNFVSLEDAAPTLGERFQEAGFVTLACVSSEHLDHARSGLGQGFDFMEAPRGTKLRAEDTLDRMQTLLAQSEGLPVFLWIHLFDAHTPYQPPEAFDRRYYPKDVDPYDPSLPNLLDGQEAPTAPGVRDLDYLRAQYRAEVAYLDHALDAFFVHERIRTATVLFTADHGESLGQHEIYWDHAGLYPDTLQVPMVLRGPGVPAGRRVSESVRQLDAGRTLLDLAGLTHVEFPGRSLLDPLLEDDDGTAAQLRGIARRPQFAIAAHGLEASIHSDRWLLILVLRNYNMNSRFVRTRHTVELFDLASDPRCLNDVTAENRDTAVRLRRELIDWLGASRSTGWGRAVDDDPETMQRMAELGYTDLGDDIDEEQPWIDLACTCPACSTWD